MTIKKSFFELFLVLYQLITSIGKKRIYKEPSEASFFILRNNDLGDLLVITPLFEAIKKNFPNSRITVGIGKWNKDVIAHNPYIDEVIYLTAPWHNKFTKPQGLKAALKYIFFHHEIAEIRKHQFDIGIDILGSQFGSLLMLRSGIPFRMGVKGYAEGYTVCQRYVVYNDQQHVGRAAIEFVELLNGIPLDNHRPQIFLSAEENHTAEQLWQNSFPELKQKIIIAPGAGFEEKCWPESYFKTLVETLANTHNYSILLLGGTGDWDKAERIRKDLPIVNLCGKLSLRESFALVAHSQLVVCNSSMMMHAAAAFNKRTFVVLGDFYDSAAQHARQWGSTNSMVLGREPEIRNHTYTPDEVMELISQTL